MKDIKALLESLLSGEITDISAPHKINLPNESYIGAPTRHFVEEYNSEVGLVRYDGAIKEICSKVKNLPEEVVSQIPALKSFSKDVRSGKVEIDQKLVASIEDRKPQIDLLEMFFNFADQDPKANKIIQQGDLSMFTRGKGGLSWIGDVDEKEQDYLQSKIDRLFKKYDVKSNTAPLGYTVHILIK